MADDTTDVPAYDVFIVYSSKDDSKARILTNALSKHGVRVFDNQREPSSSMVGRPVYDNIIHAIKLSKMVLILITKHAISSHWVTWETLVSLEKSQREEAMSVRLLFEAVTEDERRSFKRGVLEMIPDINVDFNKDDWKEHLVRSIKEEMPFQKLLPAGNIAHGLVFNYFIGYLSHILPGISKTVENSEYFTPGVFSRRFFVIIPETCEVKPLEGKHGQFIIEKMKHVLEFDVIHGDKQRKYALNVYKISKEREFYYFCADCPFILATVYKMKEMGFADIDVRFQSVKFYMTLRELVEHRSGMGYKDTTRFVMYNDTQSASGSALEIWESMKTEFSVNPDCETSTNTLIVKRGISEKDPRLTMSVTYSTNEDLDKTVAEEINIFLSLQNVSFKSEGTITTSLDGVDDARWKIFIVTESSTKDKNMEQTFSEAVFDSISKQQLQVIPVLAKGTDLESLHHRFKWVTVLKQEDPKYLDKIWKTMQESRTMDEQAPAGSVYEGLAYSYLLNYMSINLVGKTVDGRDFTERFVDAVKKCNVPCKIVPKMFVIVPTTCEFPPPGTQFKNEQHIGPTEPIMMGSRKYFLQLYVLTISTPGKWKDMRVCYAREYATPAIALRDMARLPFAGLSENEMKKQAKQFAEFSNEIMQHDIFNREIGNVKEKCSILYFEDEKHGMAGVTSLIEDKIVQCLEEGRFIEPY